MDWLAGVAALVSACVEVTGAADVSLATVFAEATGVVGTVTTVLLALSFAGVTAVFVTLSVGLTTPLCPTLLGVAFLPLFVGATSYRPYIINYLFRVVFNFFCKFNNCIKFC